MAREPRKAAAQLDPKAKEPEAEPPPIEGMDVEISDEPEVSEQQVEVAAPAAPPAPEVVEPPAEDTEKVGLRKRLQEMEEAERLTRQQLDEAQRGRDEAQRNQQRSQWQANQDRYNAVVNTIGAAQSQLDAATQELEAAGNAGDWKLVAETQRKIARAETQ